MSTTIKYGSSVISAKAFADRFTSSSEPIYVAFARGSVNWTNEPNPDPVDDTGSIESNFISNFEGMEIAQSVDIGLVVPRNSWTSGNVYVPFDSAIDRTTAFGQAFYATVNDLGTLRVYECVGNNGGVPSTVAPSGIGTNITTGDGYIWNYVYDVPLQQYSIFMSTNEGTASEWLWVPSDEVSEFYVKFGCKYVMISTKVTDLFTTTALSYRQLALLANVRDTAGNFLAVTSTRSLVGVSTDTIEFLTLENKSLSTIAVGDAEQVVVVLEF